MIHLWVRGIAKRGCHPGHGVGGREMSLHVDIDEDISTHCPHCSQLPQGERHLARDWYCRDTSKRRVTTHE